jgi:uncharacterized Zn-finger protein
MMADTSHDIQKDVTEAVGALKSTAARSTSPSRLARKKCPLCGRLFLKTDHLERHVRSHTKERPFVCATCGKQYGRS